MEVFITHARHLHETNLADRTRAAMARQMTGWATQKQTKAAPVESGRSGGHFEEEVSAEEEEDAVGGPAGEERRELADGAHGFE